MLVARVAARQYGIVTVAQLHAAGLDASAIKRRVKNGRLHRVGHGVYAVGHTGLSEEAQWLAEVFVAGAGAALSHFACGKLWQVYRYRVPRIDVVVPARRRPKSKARIHRCSNLDPTHLARGARCGEDRLMEYDDQRQREVVAPAAKRAPEPPHPLLALQQGVGNAVVSRASWLARNRNMIQQQYDDARKERDTFVAAGKKGPQTYNPSTNNAANYYGGFDVEYEPTKGELNVKLKGAVAFQDGMTLSAAGRAQAVEPSAQTAAAAAAINRMPKAARAAEVAKWTWSSNGGPDASDETDLLTGFKSSVEATWREKHPFHCTKNYWEDLGATTKINVEVAKVANAAGKAGDQHMLVNTFKVAKGFVGGSADVTAATGAGGAFGNVMNITSEDVVPRKDGLLESKVSFQPGKGLLTPRSVGTVWRLAKEMPNAAPGATIETANLTVKVQGKDAAQRKDRFDAVVDHLNQGGKVDASRVTMVEDGEGEAGTIVVGDGNAQTVAAHEAGHMFGLDDEYTGGGAYGAGKKTEHTDFAAAAGADRRDARQVRQHHERGRRRAPAPLRDLPRCPQAGERDARLGLRRGQAGQGAGRPGRLPGAGHAGRRREAGDRPCLTPRATAARAPHRDRRRRLRGPHHRGRWCLDRRDRHRRDLGRRVGVRPARAELAARDDAPTGRRRRAPGGDHRLGVLRHPRGAPAGRRRDPRLAGDLDRRRGRQAATRRRCRPAGPRRRSR